MAYTGDCITMEHLCFAFPNQARNVLDDVCVSIRPGDFWVICGVSGSGKTTLLRQLKPALRPHGRLSGRILFRNRPLDTLSERELAAGIGFVRQDPDNQIVTDKVWHELAFGLESLGLPSDVIRRRVAEMAAYFGIEDWFDRDVSALSGGQKQLLNLASVMAMQPEVLLMDEPTSQLDPIAAAEFLAAVGRINRELGVTVILTEHRLEDVLPLCSRMLVLDGGRVLAQGTPTEVGQALKAARHRMFLAMPAAMRIYAAVDSDLPCPVTVSEGRDWLAQFAQTHELAGLPPEPPLNESAEPALEAEEVWFRYERSLPDVLRGASLRACPGQLLAVLGGNGAGKTTMLSVLSGSLTPQRGRVRIAGKSPGEWGDALFHHMLGVLPQNPQALFAEETVVADLDELLRDQRLSPGERRISDVVKLCRLEGLLRRHPYDLSGGEQQRAALAKILLLQPRILLLDEPTKGMDAEGRLLFGAILTKLKAEGAAIVMVSHDLDFCARYADRCALFFNGSVVSAGRTRRFFSGNSFYTTSANRIARPFAPEAVTVEDVIQLCGGEVPEPPDPTDRDGGAPAEPAGGEPPAPRPRRPKLPRRTFLCVLTLLLTIPLTLALGLRWLGDRKYFVVSILVLLQAMAPFALAFEGRKPRARELVLLAVLCAIGVAGRTAFFMLPQFKPVLAVTIIAAAALGGESGFLVGALTMLVSNMLLQQGAHTPWQMFAAGLVGFVAGVIFHSGWLPRRRLPLCVYGFFAAVVLYGGIMNPASVILYQRTITWPMLAAACAAGLPFDLIHGFATVVFLWFGSQPLLRRLDRIQVKYGLWT